MYSAISAIKSIATICRIIASLDNCPLAVITDHASPILVLLAYVYRVHCVQLWTLAHHFHQKCTSLILLKDV